MNALLREELVRQYKQWYPKAVEKLQGDWYRIVAFYELPAERGKHIRTSDIVESPFSAMRLRTDVARRYKNERNTTALIWNVLMVAEKQLRKLNAQHLLTEAYAGVTYRDGKRTIEIGLERRDA